MSRKDCNLRPVCEICNTSVLHLKYKQGYRYPRTCSPKCKGALISKNIQPGLEERSKKVAVARAALLPSGETVAQAAARKASETMAKNGTRSVASKKRMETMKFGPSFSEKIRRGMNRIGEDGLTAAERGARAARETLIKKGVFVDPARLNEWQRYSRRVRYLTSKQPLHLLENIEKRGAIDQGGWHLDHIVSVRTGFEAGLPPEAVADLSNLRMIPAIENVRKGAR